MTRARPAFLSLPFAGLASRCRSPSGIALSLIDLSPLFQEMTMPPTPLTAIAQTPRKELESKFTFNPVMAKVRIYAFVIRYDLSSRKTYVYIAPFLFPDHGRPPRSLERNEPFRRSLARGVSIVETFRIVSSGREVFRATWHRVKKLGARRTRRDAYPPFVAGKSAFARCPLFPF